MKIKLYLSFILVCCNLLIFAQYIGGVYYNISVNRNTVFVNEANVREKPSINSNIVGILNHKTNIKRIGGIRVTYDTLNNIVGHWLAIHYKKDTAYLWNRVLSFASLNSRLFKENSFLLSSNDKNNLVFKAYKKRELIYEKEFDETNYQFVMSVVSLGKVQNSKEKEILAFVYEYHPNNDNKHLYKLFEWDGLELNKFKGKLKDDSYLTGKYTEFPYGIISSNSVNIRKEPNLDAEIVAVLQENTFVDLIKEDTLRLREKLNNNWGKWIKIQKGEKIGYVWDQFMAVPVQYIESNYSDVSFLTSSKGLYVIKDSEIQKSYLGKFYKGKDFFYEKGNLGFDKSINFIAIKYFGGVCGKYSGEIYFAWYNNKLIRIGNNGGIGDGEFSESQQLIFPTNKKGPKNEIHKSSINGEMLSTPFSKNEENYEFVSFYENDQFFKLDNDTLVEIPSKYSRLKESIKIKYPNHNLMKYKFGLINNDKIEDVIFILFEQDGNYNEYGVPKNSIAVVAYGNNKSLFEIAHTNKSILDKDYNAIELDINDYRISVTVFYPFNYIKKYVFSYDKNDKNIYWKSKSFAVNFGEKWEVNTSKFKKAKITFEITWVFDE